jgi:hypothetical protein
MTPNLSSGARVLSGRARSIRNLKSLSLLLALAALLSPLTGCSIDERQSGIPAAAQDTINIVTEDFNSGRFDKIYGEAAEEWRSRVTEEQSRETFRTLKERLGAIRERGYTSGKQQQNPGGNLPGNSLVLRYNTKFDKAEGMETVTLIERDGRYLLAGYSVSSNLLKPSGDK